MENYDPEMTSLIIGAVGMLATALGALISQIITVWSQRRKDAALQKTEDMKLLLDKEKVRDSSDVNQVQASANAVTHVFETLSDCLESRASIQDELRLQLLCNAKREIKIQSALSHLRELKSSLEDEDLTSDQKSRITMRTLREVLAQLAEKVNGLDSPPSRSSEQKGG